VTDSHALRALVTAGDR